MAAQWPRYWVWIAPERTPLAFLEALLLFSAALLAGLLALLATLEEHHPRERRMWAFGVLGFGFLGADERFALHERLRDKLLADVGLALPWGAPGDYLLLLYLGVALVLLPRFVTLLRGDRLALGMFAAGVVLAAVVLVADSFNVQAMALATERLEQSLEEVLETVADSLLAGALLVHFAERLARHVELPELDRAPTAIGEGPR